MIPTHRLRLILLALLAGAFIAPGIRGYELRTDDSGVYTIKWYEDPIPLDIRIGGSAGLNAMAQSIRDAALTWNTHLETAQFSPTILGSGTQSENERNEVVVSDQINGDDFDSMALAITLIRAAGDANVETDIVFNSDVDWDFYSGNLRSSMDVRRVALHELGHALGLEHPDDAGQSVSALMNSRVSNLDALQPDDIDGAQRLYGPKGFVPVNDAFANATTIRTEDATWTDTSSNVNASRESGEPAHADIANGHSVWWRWQATVSEAVTIDTLGSNYDTVLAVYTGEALNALTPVGSNDDTETVEDNPTPSRLRTSTVTFDAQAGTTYSFAVDGWGDPERFPAGSTGFVTFTLKRDGLRPIPVILTQPQPVTTQLETDAPISIEIQSATTATFQWQRLPANAIDWETLSESPTYVGTSFADLVIKNVSLAMDGDLFRCVVANEFGAVTSSPVLLSVTAGPTPQIVTQPSGATPLAGSFVRLSIEATDAISYQWYLDGEPIADATQGQLWIDPNLAPGTYHVEATNSNGTTRSIDAVVQATPSPIVTRLGATQRFVRNTGDSVGFEVSADGQGTIAYQWMHDGRPVLGATDPRLELTNLSLTDGGAYWARVTDDSGTRHGDPFFVVIAPPAARVQVWGGSSPIDPLPRPTFTSGVAPTGTTRAAISRTGRVEGWSEPGRQAPASGGRDVIDLQWRAGGQITLQADGTVTSNDSILDTPAAVLRGVVDIANTGEVRYALLSNGTIVAWPDSRLRSNFPDTSHLTDVIAIDAESDSAAALHADGRVTVLKTPSSDHLTTPPNPFPNAIDLAVGVHHILILHADGTVSSWGYDQFGQSTIPTGLAEVVAIDTTGWTSLALRADGTITAWGNNEYGETDVPNLLGPAFALSAETLSGMALVEVEAPPNSGSRIVNLSVRSESGPGDATLVMGFAISGDSSLPVLARGSGPTLAEFGVTGALTDPVLKLFRDTHNFASNDDWASDSELLREITDEVGAFPLVADSRDAAMLIELPARAYSAHVTPKENTPGIGLAEIYDTLQSGPERLSNVSARSFVGIGDNILIAGLVISGDSPIEVVVRGVGPELINYGLPAANVLADPQVKIFQGSDLITENNDWAGTSSLKNAFSEVGAFALTSDESKDAALRLTLDPGLYSVQVSGADGGTGIALVEIYALP
ncbi:MAG: hypothetical protein SynsKO_18820 [Synoicihabitans sp.]